MVLAILRGVCGVAFLLAGAYLFVLLTLWLGLFASISHGGHPWSMRVAFGILFYGFFSIALIIIGWRAIRPFLLPPS